MSMGKLDADLMLRHLGGGLGLEDLKLGDDSVCQLVFDQTLLVSIVFEPAHDQLNLNCPLAGNTMQQGYSVETLTQMLMANFLSHGCPGCHLSIASDGKPYLHSTVSLFDPSHEALRRSLENLLNQADIWTQRLQQGASALIASAPGQGSGVQQAPHSRGWISGRV